MPDYYDDIDGDADDYEGAQKKSKARFIKFVKPILESHLDAKVKDIEGNEQDVLKDLDMKAGLDYKISDPGGERGLSSRVQDDKNFNLFYWTFTIRKIRQSGARTELEKMKNAKEHGYIYPYWFCQSYTWGDECLNRFALAKWDDVLSLIARGYGYIQKTGKKQIGQASFFALKWSEFKNHDLPIYIYEKPKPPGFYDPVFIWPEQSKPGSPLWPEAIYRKWLSRNQGTPEQRKRYIAALEWYKQHPASLPGMRET